MTGNAIGDEGAKALSEVLKNTTLTSLNLRGEEEEKNGKEKEKKNEWQGIGLEKEQKQ